MKKKQEIYVVGRAAVHFVIDGDVKKIIVDAGVATGMTIIVSG